VDRLDPGLSDAELDAVQNRFHFTFPPDLRAVLQFALPIGKQWLDWRSGSDHDIQARLGWPLEGIQFDIENSGFWLDEWGPKPEEGHRRSEVVRHVIDNAPRLIPVYSHRFIPVEPLDAGNPVFSVHQTDIIIYGNDLADYFHREFGVSLPGSAAREPRRIRFWSDALAWWDQQENYER
jgi:hypothetical protein